MEYNKTIHSSFSPSLLLLVMSKVIRQSSLIAPLAIAPTSAQLGHHVDEQQEHQDTGQHQKPRPTPRRSRRRTVKPPRPPVDQLQRSLSPVLVIVPIGRPNWRLTRQQRTPTVGREAVLGVNLDYLVLTGVQSVYRHATGQGRGRRGRRCHPVERGLARHCHHGR